jgi:hypothetical protein
MSQQHVRCTHALSAGDSTLRVPLLATHQPVPTLIRPTDASPPPTQGKQAVPDWHALAYGIALAPALLASLIRRRLLSNSVVPRSTLSVPLQAVAHELSRTPEHSAASSHLPTAWQPVAVTRIALHFAARYVRFNPQTQFLFAARRTRTPRGALFYSIQVQVRRHLDGAGATCPIVWQP